MSRCIYQRMAGPNPRLRADDGPPFHNQIRYGWSTNWELRHWWTQARLSVSIPANFPEANFRPGINPALLVTHTPFIARLTDTALSLPC
jgi:hypothetical protein